MKKLLAFICMNLIFGSYYAMEMEKENKTKAPYISCTGHVFYFGENKIRTELEALYGQQFPLNTVFFEVNFNNIERLEKLPNYIPYDLIKDCREGEAVVLTLADGQHSFPCKQTMLGKSQFHQVVVNCYERFLQRPNFLHTDKKSLFDADVLTMGSKPQGWGYTVQHGKNCTFEAQPLIIELKQAIKDEKFCTFFKHLETINAQWLATHYAYLVKVIEKSKSNDHEAAPFDLMLQGINLLQKKNENTTLVRQFLTQE